MSSDGERRPRCGTFDRLNCIDLSVCRFFIGVMNGSAFIFPVAYVLLAASAASQEGSDPEWMALKTQFDERVRVEVQQPYDAGIVDLNVKYTTALDRALDTAQRAGKLEDALALKAEK